MRRLRLLFLLIGLGLAAWLVCNAGPQRVARMIARIGWRFPAILALYAVYVIIRAVALWRTVLGHTVRYADVLRIRLSGEAVEWLTFTGPFLAEPAKGWLLKQRGLSTAAAYAAVVSEYLLYTAASSCLGILAIALLLSRHVLPDQMRAVAALIATVMAAFLSAFTFASVSGVGLIVPILKRFRLVLGRRRAELVSREFGPVEDRIISFLHEHRRRLAAVIAIEAAAQVVLIVEIRIIMAALGSSASWIDAAMIEGGVKFVGIVFAFVPGQLGASESVYALLASAIGLSTAAGVSVALVRRLRGLAVAVIGLLAFRDR